MSVDIYQMDKRIEYFLRKLQKLEVPDENKKAITDFFNYLTARGLSKSRILIYANRLVPLAAMFEQIKFKEATALDTQKIIAEIERKDWAPATKDIYRVSLKRFYKWLLGNDEFYPECIRWLKRASTARKNVLPEELLTPEDVQKMVDASENPRDKCFISMLYESGCRVGEIAGIQIKHISFDEYGAQVMVNGKTGPRRIRLISSVHYLRYWLELHPFKEDGNHCLWPILTTKNRGKMVGYEDILRIIRINRVKAGVTKRTNPHSFRHARATELAKMGLNESQLEGLLGWIHGSNMPQIYLHLSGKDIDGALLKAYGLQAKEDVTTKRKCARCSILNDVSSTFCKDCGMPLTMKAAVDNEDKTRELHEKLAPLMELLKKDKETREFLAEKMKRSN